MGTSTAAPGADGGTGSETASPAALRIYIEALIDADLAALRTNYCQTVQDALVHTAAWFAADTWLGSGDVPPDDGGRGGPMAPPAGDRRDSFRGASAVMSMSAELARGAVALLRGDNRYAAAALVRQLIETEYLLTAFAEDFAHAATWRGASHEEVRSTFSPSRMRKLGSFSADEYARHCDQGGHPSPRGILFLSIAATETEEAVGAALMWLDLAQHLRRIWQAASLLLRREHARFEVVRATTIDSVAQATAAWADQDPLSLPVDFAELDAWLDASGRPDSQ